MKLDDLPGIGPKTEEALRKAGIESVSGLLEFYPRDFEIFKEPVAVSQAQTKTFAAIKGAFAGSAFVRSVNGKKMVSAVFKDETGSQIRAVWFNAPYIKDQISPGRLYVLKGRITRKYNVLSLNQPKIFSPEEYYKRIGVMQPVYPYIKGVSSNVISRAVKYAINCDEFENLCSRDALPDSVREKYGLMPLKDAVKNMHFPSSAELYGAAARRLSFEEIFLFILSMKKKGKEKRPGSRIIINDSDKTKAFLDSLPFKLTNSQKTVIGEINSDMSSGFLMNRLLQGDVGSGKTIAALAALMNAAYSGYQGVLMAPTEVLAAQHFETIDKFFKEARVNIHTSLLTGSMSALEKKAAYDAIEDGRVQIIIGTHAVFQEKVKYKDLGLVITDEQHRFGTNQRRALAQKGDQPHMLVMSATPIPRTLALILYGDMDVSTINAIPSQRLPVKNAVVDESYRPNAYRFIEKEVRKGRQAYIICPLIEYSDGLEANNVTDYTQMIRDIFPEDISIGMLHGNMKAGQKNEIMQAFCEGKIQILVSTTVVEVGVDVPNASVMMIEDADRFGLAQLHQLRGRVGRGKDQSYCIFVSNNSSKEAKKRLETLLYCNDGFEIARKDLEMRGPGEFLGTRQSGAFAFKYFDESRDTNIAMEALEAAEGLLSGALPVSMPELEVINDHICKDGEGIVL